MGSRSKMPLMGRPPRKAGCSDTIAQNAERLTNFSDDVGETGLRRQRVADDGDVDAVGARSVGEEGEHVLVVALPIAAVNEDEQRRPCGCRRRSNRSAR